MSARKEKKTEQNKKYEAIRVRIWLVRIPGCARSFPDVHCCSGLQKWPREQTSSSEEWLEVAMGRKKDRQ